MMAKRKPIDLSDEGLERLLQVQAEEQDRKRKLLSLRKGKPSDNQGLGKLQRLILWELARREIKVRSSELCWEIWQEHYKKSKFDTFKTAFSRAIWTLCDQGMVDIEALAWMMITNGIYNSEGPWDKPKDAPKVKCPQTYEQMFYGWFGQKGGHRPAAKYLHLGYGGQDWIDAHEDEEEGCRR